MSLTFMRNLSNDDIKAIFNTGNDDFIQQRRNKIDENRILKGDVTPEEYEYLRNRLDAIVVKDAFEFSEMITPATHKTIFPYEPSELVSLTNHFNKLRLTVPVIEYNETNGIVATKFDLSTAQPETIEATVAEELFLDDNVDMFKRIINSQMNMKIEDKIIEALESTQCTANNFVDGIAQLDRKYRRNIVAIVPLGDFIDNPRQYDYLGKIKVFPCDVSNVFFGDLNAIVSNAYVDGVKYQKDVVNGMYTIVQKVYNLNAVLTDKTAAIVKIV